MSRLITSKKATFLVYVLFPNFILELSCFAYHAAQKMQFSIKGFFSKCEQTEAYKITYFSIYF